MTYDIQVLWVLEPLKSPLVSTLNVLAFLRVFVSGLFKVSHEHLDFKTF